MHAQCHILWHLKAFIKEFIFYPTTFILLQGFFYLWLLGNNPTVDGLHCTLVDSMKERAFLSVRRRHMVWFVTQDHSTGETKNLSMDGLCGVYHGNSFGFCLMLGDSGALSDWWHVIYSLSVFSFQLPVLLYYLLPSFSYWGLKKTTTLCPTPWCSTHIHSQK